jgi:hypothetical protein
MHPWVRPRAARGCKCCESSRLREICRGLKFATVPSLAMPEQHWKPQQ